MYSMESTTVMSILTKIKASSMTIWMYVTLLMNEYWVNRSPSSCAFRWSVYSYISYVIFRNVTWFYLWLWEISITIFQDKEDRWWLTSTAGSDGVVSVDEWTPLPAMCSHCRRRKTSQSLDKFILTSVSLNDKNLDSCHNNPLPNFDMISNLNKSRLGDDQRTQIVGASSVSINQKNAVCNAPRKTTNSSSLSAPVSKSINPLSSKSICPVNASTNKQVSNMTKKKMPVNPSSGKVSSKIVMKSQSIMQSFGKSKVDSSQRTHTIENREVNDVNAAVTNDLQCCPLCQKQFEAR